MRRSIAATLAAVAAATALAGCVERKMIVRSDPPGALLSVDGRELEAPTPAEVPVTWGGGRRITLTAPGYRIFEGTADVKDPWFTYFPLDVFAELLLPATIHDVQTFTYKLQPMATAEPSKEQIEMLRKRLAELKLRAAEARAAGSRGPGAVAPSPAAPPPPKPADAPPTK